MLFFCEIDFESNLILFLCVYVQKKAPREMEYLRTTEDTMNYALAQSRICNYGQYMRIKLFGPSQPYAFVANKYPYVTSDDCRHMLMWLHPTYAKFYDAVRVRKIILSRYPSAVNIFMNPERFRSVPAVLHYHFFVRMRPSPRYQKKLADAVI